MTRHLILFSAVAMVLASCAGDAPVKFGAALPLSGDAAIYGRSVEKGIQLAFDELAADTSYPYTLELDIRDTQTSPDVAAQLMTELGEAGALGVIGGVTSAEALAMVPAAERVDKILLSPSASSPEFTGISRNFFRIFPSDFLEGTKMGNFSTQTLAKQSAVILAKEEPHARAIQEVFKTEFERYGGSVLEVLEVPAGPMDITGLVSRVLELNPDAVYLAGFAPDIASMLRDLKSGGYEGTVLTTHAFAAPEVIARAGDQAHGVFLTKPSFDVTSQEPIVQEFVTAFSTAFGISPDLYAAHGYDAMMILAEGLKGGGRLDKDFMKGLRAIQDFPGVAGTIQFDEKGDVQKFPRVYLVDAQGELVNYEEEVERQKKAILEKRRELEEKIREAQRKARSGP